MASPGCSGRRRSELVVRTSIINRPGGVESGVADGVGAAIEADLVHRSSAARRWTKARTSRTSSSTRRAPKASRPISPRVVRDDLIQRRYLRGVARASSIRRRRLHRRLEPGHRPSMPAAWSIRRGIYALHLGRAALSGLPCARSSLGRRRQLAARPLADRPRRRRRRSPSGRDRSSADYGFAGFDVSGLAGALDGYVDRPADVAPATRCSRLSARLSSSTRFESAG